MPYKNIHWIKLEKRLLNDYRFFTMSEDAQLVYVKLLMFAAASGNRMVRELKVLASVLRYKGDLSKLQVALDEIRTNFPKFRTNRYYYYFKEFENRLNWVVGDTEKGLLGNSLGTPKGGVDKNKIKNKNKIRLDKKRVDTLNLSKDEKEILTCFLDLSYKIEECNVSSWQAWLAELKKDNPDKNLLTNAKKWRDYFEQKPPKNYKSSFRNWISKEYADKELPKEQRSTLTPEQLEAAKQLREKMNSKKLK